MAPNRGLCIPLVCRFQTIAHQYTHVSYLSDPLFLFHSEYGNLLDHMLSSSFESNAVQQSQEFPEYDRDQLIQNACARTAHDLNTCLEVQGNTGLRKEMQDRIGPKTNVVHVTVGSKEQDMSVVQARALTADQLGKPKRKSTAPPIHMQPSTATSDQSRFQKKSKSQQTVIQAESLAAKAVSFTMNKRKKPYQHPTGTVARPVVSDAAQRNHRMYRNGLQSTPVFGYNDEVQFAGVQNAEGVIEIDDDSPVLPVLPTPISAATGIASRPTEQHPNVDKRLKRMRRSLILRGPEDMSSPSKAAAYQALVDRNPIAVAVAQDSLGDDDEEQLCTQDAVTMLCTALKAQTNLKK